MLAGIVYMMYCCCEVVVHLRNEYVLVQDEPSRSSVSSFSVCLCLAQMSTPLCG